MSEDTAIKLLVATGIAIVASLAGLAFLFTALEGLIGTVNASTIYGFLFVGIGVFSCSYANRIAKGEETGDE